MDFRVRQGDTTIRCVACHILRDEWPDRGHAARAPLIRERCFGLRPRGPRAPRTPGTASVPPAFSTFVDADNASALAGEDS